VRWKFPWFPKNFTHKKIEHSKNDIRKQGVVLPFIRDFIKMRHNLGYKSKSIESGLKAFDAFAYREGLREVTIPKEPVLKWCKSRKEEATDTWSKRTNYLRQFSTNYQTWDTRHIYPPGHPANTIVLLPHTSILLKR